ncbi:pyridoxal-phosphate dependent enzyme, partial [Arthrospira sp. PCC 8006]|uniref:pyridoxal-phosphate dependent enzyme n=1 Tax=Arthrospira sp. PCC 8006 TaxID=1982224 RepID=UPI00396F3449
SVVVPENAPKVKIAAIRNQGAETHFCAPGIKSREKAMQDIIEKNGYHFIPPYNHLDIIEGQSTCAREMLQQNPNIDLILSPVGGGGLLSGTLLACE